MKYALEHCVQVHNPIDRTITFIGVCPHCHEGRKIKVAQAGLIRCVKKGVLIQDAFPNLNDDDREFLISGTCPTCFDEMFKEEEDD